MVRVKPFAQGLCLNFLVNGRVQCGSTGGFLLLFKFVVMSPPSFHLDNAEKLTRFKSRSSFITDHYKAEFLLHIFFICSSSFL